MAALTAIRRFQAASYAAAALRPAPVKARDARDALSGLDGRPVVYLGYVGTSAEDEALFKYGISRRMPQRAQAHRRTFGLFEPVLVAECAANRRVEAALTRLWGRRGMLRTAEAARGGGGRLRELVAAAAGDAEGVARDFETVLLLAEELAPSLAASPSLAPAPRLLRFERK